VARAERPEWFKKTFGAFRFRSEVYSGDPSLELADRIRSEVNLEKTEENRVFLLGQITYLGFYFSPVNFYFIGSQGNFHTLVAEVSNTPWGEKHCYVIPLSNKERKTVFRHSKNFHVSPFMSSDQDYRWMVEAREGAIKVSITNIEAEKPIFTAALTLHEIDLNQKSLWCVLTNNFGWMLSTRILIYWQALKLFIKGVPFIPYVKKSS
jgi:DUF1365 family protein